MTRSALRILTFAAFGLTLSAPAVAEVTKSSDSGFVSRHEAVVEATPKEVWLALISPSGWWNSDHTWSGDAANLTLTPQAGGCFCETIPEVDEPERFTLQGSVEHMRVIHAYPEKALRMQGALGPLQSEPVIGVLTVAISKAEQGTRIVWEYNVGGSMRYEVPVISKAVDGVMGAQLASLAKKLGPIAPADKAAAPAADPEAAAKPEEAPAKKPAPMPEPAKPAAPAATKPADPAKPAPKPTTEPAPKPAAPVKPAPKPASVDESFADIEAERPQF
jgi:hypothetical protein